MRLNFVRFGSAAFFIGMFCLCVWARLGAEVPAPAPADPDGLTPAAAKLLDACFDDYSELDFAAAESAARQAMALCPDSVLPVLYLQAELTSQIQELVQAHADASGPESRFKQATQAALSLESAREASLHDGRAQLYLGNTLGLAGLVDLCEHRLWAAHRQGEKGYTALLLAQKRDPGLEADADLGKGEYVYFCGRMSGFLRTLLRLPGDVPGGIALEAAAARGAEPRLAVQARVNLAEMLTTQVPDFAAALPYIQEVESRYPLNWASEQESLAEAKGLGLDRPEARTLVETVAARWDAGWRPPAYEAGAVVPGPQRLDLALWYLAHGRVSDAARHLKAVASGSGPPAQEAARVLLTLGQ